MKRAAKPAPADAARKQAVIYARVSSKEQGKEGFSIPAQLKLLKEYAAANGFAVAHEYIDVETAKQTGRVAFGEMVAYLKAHPSVRVMLVEKTDRLYRNLKAKALRFSTSPATPKAVRQARIARKTPPAELPAIELHLRRWRSGRDRPPTV